MFILLDIFFFHMYFFFLFTPSFTAMFTTYSQMHYGLFLHADCHSQHPHSVAFILLPLFLCYLLFDWLFLFKVQLIHVYLHKKSHGSYKTLKYTRCRKLVQKIFSHWHIQKQIILHVLLSCTLVGYIPFLQFSNINPFLQFVMIPVLFLLLFSNGLLFTKAD